MSLRRSKMAHILIHELSRWASSDMSRRNSFLLWHKKYLIPNTLVLVLGYVACPVTPKLCGLGPAERSWGGVKQVNDEKMSHLSGKSTEKRISILFDLLKISHAWSHCDRMKQLSVTGQEAILEMMISILICSQKSLVFKRGRWRKLRLSVFFGHGWKIVKKTYWRKMAVMLRHNYLPYITVLFFMILTQRSCFWFGSKIWSTAGREEMDGSWLVFVQMMKTTMRPYCWKLHVNW